MANALEAASLIMVPSGYEDGTLGSLKPTDGSGDFTFTRGSNLSATRINEQGYIEKGYENLLLQSNTFSDAAWLNQGNAYTITSGQAGYDGTNDAWLIDKSTTGNEYLRQDTSVSGVYTASIYAKAGTSNSVMIYAVGGYGTWDLSSGTFLSGGGSYISQSIDSVGNGWYRIQVTGNITNVFYIQPKNSGASDAGSIYIQDAMLNQGLVAYPYIETTTAPVAGGILEDEPRIDFSDGCGHLLLEPSRTNVVQFSEYAGSSYWSKLNSSVTDNAIISPEGLNNAFELTDNTTNGYHWIYQGNLGSFSTHRVSFFAKANTLSQVWSNGGGGSNNAGFDLSNGTIIQENGTSNPTIEDYGNGWYRCSYTADLKGLLIATMKDNDNTYAGTGESIYLYGIQSEQDATYPTSYIPTYGVSQTRLDDSGVASNVASLINSTQGTIFFEGKSLSSVLPNYNYFISLSDSTSANRMEIRQNTDEVQFLWRVNNSYQSQIITIGITITDFWKVALKYSSTEIKMFFNGSLVDTISSPTLYSANTLNRVGFDDGLNNFKSKNKVKQVLYFPTALSDDECIALTTI